MPAPVQPIKRPRRIVANVKDGWWTTCVHYTPALPGPDKCNLPGKTTFLPFTICGKCKHYTHREPQ